MNRISGQSRMLIAVAMCLRTYLWHSTRCVFSKYTGQVCLWITAICGPQKANYMLVLHFHASSTSLLGES